MKYKVWVYGIPFSGKSYFADTFPNAYVINTDGNFQFYDTVQGEVVANYQEFVNALSNFDPDIHDTLVIDLVDHVYDMARENFLNNHGIEHETDFQGDGAFGKGWTLMREGFWYMISKIRAIDANVVLISHDAEKEVKGRLGTTRTMYGPATVPDNIVSKMTGIMHFVGRVYREDDDFKVSFGGNDNEVSGHRLPIKELIIDNTYDDFIDNLE